MSRPLEVRVVGDERDVAAFLARLRREYDAGAGRGPYQHSGGRIRYYTRVPTPIDRPAPPTAEDPNR